MFLPPYETDADILLLIPANKNFINHDGHDVFTTERLSFFFLLK